MSSAAHPAARPAPASAREPVHLVIPTHTTRHLEPVLRSVAAQQTPPASLIVTCDVEDERIDRLLRDAVARFPSLAPLHHVRRPHQGKARISQVRNNAVRRLLELGHDTGRVLVIDGDTWLAPDTVDAHERIGAGHGMVVASRIMLDEQRTAAFLDRVAATPDDAPLPRPEPTAEDAKGLAREHRRARFHAGARRIGLAKPHKPKILGGHFSMSLDLYREINGCDEAYEGWGQEDDDLGRRAYAAGGDSVVAIAEIPVFHLHHPTRAGRTWSSGEGHARFIARDWTVRCPLGLDTPRPQTPVRADVLGA